MSRTGARVMSTGIAGFDAVTDGGLPVGRPTIVLGGPGNGKTIFGLQTLVHGVRCLGEPGIFVSFDEPATKLREHMAAFDWALDDEDKLALIDARMPVDAAVSGDFDLVNLLTGITARAKAMKARRLVLDAIDIPLSFLGDFRSVSRELLRLDDWLRSSELTGVITIRKASDRQSGILDLEFAEYMADCVVDLSSRLDGHAATRWLRVTKYRGNACSPGEHPMVITANGIEVTAESGKGANLEHTAHEDRISTGVPRLDAMLDGGYYRGSATLISGVSGTAKTTLAACFAAAACQRGERVLYFSFDEGASQIVRNMRSTGLELGPHVADGRLTILSRRARTQSSEQHFITLRTAVEETGCDAIVVDSIGSLNKTSSSDAAEVVAQRLVDFCKTEGRTVVLTTLTDSQHREAEATPLRVSTIADTWIHLSYLAQGGERNRTLSIIKSRGTGHSNQVREMILTDHGVTLSDVYTAGGDVLMGTARLERERANIRRSEEARSRYLEQRRELQGDLDDLLHRRDSIVRDIEDMQARLANVESAEEERTCEDAQMTVKVAEARSADQAGDETGKRDDDDDGAHRG